MTRTVFSGSYFLSTTVSAGSKRSQAVSAEAKYDGQSLQEAKIGGLVYTLRMSSNENDIITFLKYTVTFTFNMKH